MLLNLLEDILNDKGYGEFTGGSLWVNDPSTEKCYVLNIPGHRSFICDKAYKEESFFPTIEEYVVFGKIYLKYKYERNVYYKFWEEFVKRNDGFKTSVEELSNG